MVPQNCSVSHILQNIFLCVQQNKDIHTGLDLLEGEKMITELSFLGEVSHSVCQACFPSVLHQFTYKRLQCVWNKKSNGMKSIKDIAI